MCIFSGEVESVTNTRILISPLDENKQLTVYENQVQQSQKRNAMVLPVPNGGDGIALLDLSNIKGDIWASCEALFLPQTLGLFTNSLSTKSSEFLEVFKVGGYLCSIALSIDDLSRISTNHFDLPPNIAAILRDNYAQGFSFVVCVFEGNVAAHPIAYISSRLANGRCFIPTRHAHGGDNRKEKEDIHYNIRCDVCQTTPIRGMRWKCVDCPDYDMCDSCFQYRRREHNLSHSFVSSAHTGVKYIPYSERKNAVDVGDFDHTLYLVNSVMTADPRRYSNIKTVSINSLPQTLLQLPCPMQQKCMTRVKIEGDFENGDYECVEVY